MKVLVALFLVLATCAPAHAQLTCTGQEACVAWTPPITMTDGAPITGALTFKVFAQAPNDVPKVVATTAAREVKVLSLAPGEWCFFIRAVVASVESDSSNISCKTIRRPGPTDGSIEAPTDGSIEYPK